MSGLSVRLGENPTDDGSRAAQERHSAGRNRHAQRVRFRRRDRPQVEFHLTGGNYNDASIGLATATGFGWVYNWNTQTMSFYDGRRVTPDTVGARGP
jgi:hypothetical protein